jgi:hypothetical protein
MPWVKSKLRTLFRLITLDTVDLYIKLPITEIIHITKVLLNWKQVEDTITQQTILLPHMTFTQNYFQFENSFYKPNSGDVKGSPISDLAVETFLQF